MSGPDETHGAEPTDSIERAPAGWRLHALVGALPGVWAAFHLWEQWSAFAGRDAWAARAASTSVGPGTIVVEIVGALLPALAWSVLALSLGKEPAALRSGLAEDPELARRLGSIARACSWLFVAWLAYHASWLWAPKLLEGAEPMRAWAALQGELGTWPHVVAHSIGLTAFTVHVAASVPRVAIAYGFAPTPESRRAARLSGLIVAVGMLVLYAQLAGWHAAGRGVVWSL